MLYSFNIRLVCIVWAFVMNEVYGSSIDMSCQAYSTILEVYFMPVRLVLPSYVVRYVTHLPRKAFTPQLLNDAIFFNALLCFSK